MRKLLTLLFVVSLMSCSDFKKGFDEGMKDAEAETTAVSADSLETAVPADSSATDSVQ